MYNKIQESILSTIDYLLSNKLKSVKFDFTERGKVVSISSDKTSCDVEINGHVFTCKIRNGISISVNDVVLVKVLNNNYSDKIVDGKIGAVIEGGSGEGGTYVSSDFDHNQLKNYKIEEHRKINDLGESNIDLWSAQKIKNEINNVSVDLEWDNIEGKPISNALDIDDAVEKSHDHTNKSLLDSITQVLVDRWNSAWTHINDSIKHITSSERTLWNTVSDKSDKVYVDTELNKKVDKVAGKQLSTEDYTTQEKNKLASVDNNANNYTHPSAHPASMITESTTRRFTSDTEKSIWNSKSDFSGNYNDLTNKPLDDDFKNLIKTYSVENSDELLIYKVSSDTYNKVTKQDLLAGLGGNNSDFVFVVKQQEFTSEEGQINFDLINEEYSPNTNRMNVYVWGTKQPNNSFNEISKTRVQLKQGVSEGTKVILEWFHIVNVTDYIHAQSHAIGGSDPITPEMILGTGTNSQYLRGDGTWAIPPNTTYSAMTVAEGQTATATSSRTVRADYLKQIIQHHARPNDWIPENDHLHPNKSTLDGISSTDITNWNNKSTLGLGETSVTAYRGDRGKVAYDHSQIAHAPSNANFYAHPTGFSNQPATALSGANVVSQITVNTEGHVSAITSRALTPANIGAEPSFTKNTGFNKNFGTASGTVCEGNDVRLSDARTPLAHNHDAGNITSGVLADARIPNLNASKITAGTFDIARIPNMNMSKITTGSLSTDRLTEPSFVTGSITRTARPLFDVLRADRTAFLPSTQIIIERSTDGGATWQDHQVSDVNKRRLFTGQRPNITIPLKDGVRNTDCMIRITITGMRYNVPQNTPEIERYDFWNSSYVQSTERYFSAMEGWIWVSSVADRIYCKVEKATGLNPNSWSLDREAFMLGWPSGNYFSLSGSTFGGGTTQTSNFWNWRFTFRTATTSSDFDNAKLSSSYASAAQSVFHIKISGSNVWVTPNNLMYNDHLYSWDEGQNATFPANLRVNGELLINGIRKDSVWDSKADGVHAHALTNLTDVTVTTPVTGHTLRYNGTSWLNAFPTMNDNTDIALTSVVSGNFLRHNGTNWVNTTLIAGDIPNLDTAKITTGTFADARIPNLNASKITAGTFAIGLIPTGTTSSTVALGNHGHTDLHTHVNKTVIDGISSTDISNWNGKQNSLGTGTTSQYLRGDGTWQIPPNTTYSAGSGIVLSGTTFSVAGGNGLTQETSGLALGTPSTLNTSTTNGVTASSHTHAVTFPVTSVAGKTGAVTLSASDVGLGNVTNESKATMFTSPTFTGTPTAPTASVGTNTTQIATTAFVQSAITGAGSLVLGETSDTAYRGDRGKIAYDHAISSHQMLTVADTRSAVDTPNDIASRSFYPEFKSNTSVNNPPVSTGSSYSHILNMNGWTSANGGSGGHTTQLAFGDGLAIRQSTSTTTWGDWIKLLNANGDTMMGKLSLSVASNRASINIPRNGTTDPTGTVSGDLWYRSNNLYYNDQGTVRAVAHTGSWSTVTQAEAEAGTATTQRLWTAQRVRQAIESVSPYHVGVTAPSNTNLFWVDTSD